MVIGACLLVLLLFLVFGAALAHAQKRSRFEEIFDSAPPRNGTRPEYLLGKVKSKIRQLRAEESDKLARLHELKNESASSLRAEARAAVLAHAEAKRLARYFHFDIGEE